MGNIEPHRSVQYFRILDLSVQFNILKYWTSRFGSILPNLTSLGCPIISILDLTKILKLALRAHFNILVRSNMANINFGLLSNNYTIISSVLSQYIFQILLIIQKRQVKCLILVCHFRSPLNRSETVYLM